MIDKQQLRGYFDELGISTRLDADGDLVIIQRRDDDFGHDVVIYVMLSENGRLAYTAGAPGYEPHGDLYQMANRNNCRKVMPTAVVRDGKLRMEVSFFLDEEVSKEYIAENCIKMPLSCIWSSFVDFEKEM